MKISLFNSTLSCKTKCIRIFNIVEIKRLILIIFFLGFLNACGAPTAMLGPAYTLTSTGSVFQAGLSYGSGELVKKQTGKTTIENLIEIKNKNKKKKANIKKKTLESLEFINLVNKKIKSTGEFNHLSNQ